MTALQPDPAAVEHYREQLRQNGVGESGRDRRLGDLAYGVGAFAEILHIAANRHAAGHTAAVGKWLARGLALAAALDAERAESERLSTTTDGRPATTPQGSPDPNGGRSAPTADEVWQATFDAYHDAAYTIEGAMSRADDAVAQWRAGRTS